MAVDPPVLYNGFWTYTRAMVSPYGSNHLNPSNMQIANAYKIRSALQQQGYCEKAIAGVIGCSQVESGITSGAIQKWSVLPNQGERLSDVPNSYMLQYYTPSGGGQGYGLGLLQWDRYSALYQTNDLLGWTNANGFVWYDYVGQMARLEFEFNNDGQYNFWHLNYGSSLTWAAYKDLENTFPTYGADDAADVWTSCWELSSLDPVGRQYRKDNGAFWYQYFIDHPTPPVKLSPFMYGILTKKKGLTKHEWKFF